MRKTLLKQLAGFFIYKNCCFYLGETLRAGLSATSSCQKTFFLLPEISFLWSLFQAKKK